LRQALGERQDSWMSYTQEYFRVTVHVNSYLHS
jgi:hypothetical protein